MGAGPQAASCIIIDSRTRPALSFPSSLVASHTILGPVSKSPRGGAAPGIYLPLVLMGSRGIESGTTTIGLSSGNSNGRHRRQTTDNGPVYKHLMLQICMAQQEQLSGFWIEPTCSRMLLFPASCSKSPMRNPLLSILGRRIRHAPAVAQ